MKYKYMRDYSHEEFINIIKDFNENEIIEFSKKYGGYPVLIRMALDEKVNTIPFIQTGSAIIIRNKEGRILLQERTDRNQWCLPGGCQELAETLEETALREIYEETGIKLELKDLFLINVVSGESRKNTYNLGDIVYNNTSLYLVDINDNKLKDLKFDINETKRLKFFKLNELPKNLMDFDLIETYLNYLKKEQNET